MCFQWQSLVVCAGVDACQSKSSQSEGVVLAGTRQWLSISRKFAREPMLGVREPR